MLEREKGEIQILNRYLASQIHMLEARIANGDVTPDQQGDCNKWLTEYKEKMATNEEKRIENQRAREALWLDIYSARTR